MAKVSVVVVTYNALRWVQKCFGSLKSSDYPVDIVVVDNASTDDTVQYIRSHFPEACLKEADRNLGFGLANNLGMELARSRGADYIFLLNQDAWVQPSTIGQLLMGFALHSDTSILSPIHLNGDGNELDLYFKIYMKQGGHPFDLHHPSSGPRYMDLPFVNAAAWLLPTELLKKVGGFDPIFFHYGEDRHYSARVLFHGGHIRVDTHSFICHDRQERIQQAGLNPAPTLDREWIHFLTQACHPGLEDYGWFAFKRTMRHFLTALIGIFRGSFQGAGMHATIASRIVTRRRQILVARQRSQNAELFLPCLYTQGS
jgi:GT2 family glycosyltransferase